MKILIIDDNAGIRQFLNIILAPLAHEIFQCEDGSEAFDMYTKIKPDWILMDIKMKRMDGITAASSIHEFYPLAKIIIVTDYDDVQLKARAFQAGACGFVLKENIFEVVEIIKNNFPCPQPNL
ncbi:MAG: response regulator transcription factor [Ignavibacteriaceae bacterium]